MREMGGMPASSSEPLLGDRYVAVVPFTLKKCNCGYHRGDHQNTGNCMSEHLAHNCLRGLTKMVMLDEHPYLLLERSMTAEELYPSRLQRPHTGVLILGCDVIRVLRGNDRRHGRGTQIEWISKRRFAGLRIVDIEPCSNPVLLPNEVIIIQ